MKKILFILITLFCFVNVKGQDTLVDGINASWVEPDTQEDTVMVSEMRIRDLIPDKIIPSWIEPDKIFDETKQELSQEDVKLLEEDVKFMTELPQSYESVSKEDLKNVLTQIDNKIVQLKQEIDNLIKASVNVVLSPKIILIFLINFKIVYGQLEEFKDPVEFIKKNKKLIKEMVKTVTDIVIEKLMSIVMKRVTKLATEVAAKKATERNKDKLSQLLSLTGVPQEALRIIKGLS